MFSVTNLLSAAAGLLGACSFKADFDGTRYACDPAAPSCPTGQTCASDGRCHAPGDPPAHDPPDAPAAQQPRPDAAPDGPPSIIHLAFGERATADVHGVTTDTYLDLSAAATNFGADTAASFDADPVRNALLRFDLAAAPAGAQVDAAELVLYIFDPLETGDCVIARVTEPWSEHDASYALRTATLPWTTPGGTVGDTVQTFTPRAIGEYTVALPPALVQGWIDQPATNDGVRFASTSPDGRGGQWSTSDEPAEGQRPLLRLTMHRF